MLSAAELRHFAEKGWVLRPAVFSEAECRELRDATDCEIDAAAGPERDKLLGMREADDEDGAHYGRMVVSGTQDSVAGPSTAIRAEVFRKWRRHPAIVPALEQLLGCAPQFTGSMVLVTPPHARRHEPEMREVLRDSGEMVWHRGIRPKWGVRQGARPGEIYTSWLHTCTFLSDISHTDDGGTLMLSGSHRLDVESTTGAAPEPEESLGRAGRVVHQVPDWAECLRNREQAVGPAGSVVHFSEALIHAGLAVLSETTRYAMFVDCTPSAMATGDKSTDTRVGWRPQEIVKEPWDLAGPEYDNPLVRMHKL